jgi:hypothetical protein
MKETEKDNVKVVGTKMGLPFWRRFKRVLTKIGVSEYSYFQNCADVLVRNGDDRHNLTPDMEQAMAAFEHCEGWDKNFNLADPTTKPEITEATYYLRDKEKKGARVVHVEGPWLAGDAKTWTQTFNVQQILEKFLCLTFPQLYRRLRFIAVCRDCNSVLELLYKVVTELESEENKKEFLKPFEDAERSEWGKTPMTQPYKIKHRRDVDEMEGVDDLFNQPQLTPAPQYERPEYDKPVYDSPNYDSDSTEEDNEFNY